MISNYSFGEIPAKPITNVSQICDVRKILKFELDNCIRRSQTMLRNAYLLANIGADTVDKELSILFSHFVFKPQTSARARSCGPTELNGKS